MYHTQTHHTYKKCKPRPLTSAASGKWGLTNQHIIWWSVCVNFNNVTVSKHRVALSLLPPCISITKTPQEAFNPFTQWLKDHFKCGFSCCVLINSFHAQQLKTKVIPFLKIYISKTFSQRCLKIGNFVTLSCLYCFYTLLYLECILKKVLIKVHEATSFGLKYVFFTFVLLQTLGAILELSFIHLCSVLSIWDFGQHQVWWSGLKDSTTINQRLVLSLSLMLTVIFCCRSEHLTPLTCLLVWCSLFQTRKSSQLSLEGMSLCNVELQTRTFPS